MYHKILTASDPEGLAEQTVPVVTALVRGTDATVRVVAVEEALAPAARHHWLVKHLDRLVTDLQYRGVSAEASIRMSRRDHIAHHVAAAATEWGADLIVLGSHRRGDLRSLVVGSVGHGVASHTRTPLLFVGSKRGQDAAPELPPTDQRRVLVAIDYDHASQTAVETVIGISSPKTRVHVIHVQTLPGAGAVDGYLPEDLIERDREAGHYLVEGALQRLAGSGIHATWEIFQRPGEVAKVIARAAADFDADVIVLGSRRLPTALALVAGSVAHDVIAATDRSVLLAGAEPDVPATVKAVPAAEPTGRH